MITPVDYVRITQRFGQSLVNFYGLTGHQGMDYGPAVVGKPGERINAADSGIATIKPPAGAYGLHIIIDHGDGLTTMYAHLSHTRIINGSKVSIGQHIGDMGNTGQSTNVHLHFGVKKWGIWRNPEKYLTHTRMELEDRMTQLEQNVVLKDNRAVIRAEDGKPFAINHETMKKFPLDDSVSGSFAVSKMAIGTMTKSELKQYKTANKLSNVL